ncbi:MAG: hypothetical protein Alpg2KO_29520 [Alphaproteobacteria bacterium]
MTRGPYNRQKASVSKGPPPFGQECVEVMFTHFDAPQIVVGKANWPPIESFGDWLSIRTV